jgi:hypothetical protein
MRVFRKNPSTPLVLKINLKLMLTTKFVRRALSSVSSTKNMQRWNLQKNVFCPYFKGLTKNQSTLLIFATGTWKSNKWDTEEHAQITKLHNFHFCILFFRKQRFKFSEIPKFWKKLKKYFFFENLKSFFMTNVNKKTLYGLIFVHMFSKKIF